MLTHPAIVRQRSAPKGRGYTSAAGILAWTLDAFDFFALVFMVDNLATHFQVGKSSVVLSIGAALAMQPVGALIFSG
jgi:SHS family lactate transporter-like MFS transporter